MREPYRLLIAVACLISSLYSIECCDSHFDEPCVEEFEDNWQSRWLHSRNSQYQGTFESAELAPDHAIKVPREALHYALTSVLKEPVPLDDGVILQFEAKWAKKHQCSGGYLKYYSHTPDFKAEGIGADTEYTIMFGPDKCGNTNKVHLILKHKNTKSGKVTEKHLIGAPSVPLDTLTHVYTAVIRNDNTYDMLIDGEPLSTGSLFSDFDPPIVPPKLIDDPSDNKPEDWVDEETIEDPEDVKPEDWVEEAKIIDEAAKKPEGWLEDSPAFINDPSAEKPEDWDHEEDGEWFPPTIPNPACAKAPGCGPWSKPLIDNPEYKGKWRPRLIPNPDYKGEWKPKQIENPEYYDDKNPLKNMKPITAVGIEIWTMNTDIYFDNILIVKDPAVTTEFVKKWKNRNKLEEDEEAANRSKEMANNQKDTGLIRNLIKFIVDEPSLAPLKPYSTYLLDLADNNPLSLYGLLSAFFSTILFLLVTCCIRIKKKRPNVADPGRAKKEDITNADIPESSNSDGEKKEAGASKKGKKKETKEMPTEIVANEEVEEVEEDKEEEDKEDKDADESEIKPASTRRRPRRVND